MVYESDSDLILNDFVRELALRVTGGDHAAFRILTIHLKQSVDAAVSQTLYNMGFISAGNPNILVCNMPHNPHSYRQTRTSKHCTLCGADYCDDHPLSNCVKCGNQL